jgi:hypothetical protein
MGILYSRKMIVVLMLVLAYASILNAQVTTASINGVVTDKSGQPLTGATVRAIHEPSGSQYGTSSRDDGRFNLTGLRIGGPYTIKITYVGYTAQEKKGINLELGQNLQINFSITEEAVEVNAVVITGEQQNILSAAHTGAVSNVSRSNIESLPSITRTFTDYLKLSPYFIGNSAQGRNYKYNNIQIDGANFNDLFGLGTSGMPGLSTVAPISLESIQEFQISVSPYDVRQSGFTGAGVNAVTRSGSNNLSAALYAYGRNQSFVGNSPDALHSSYADFYDIQEGFRVGGAIVKDKLFYFVSGELTQYNKPLTRTFGSATTNNMYSLAQDSLNMFIDKLKSLGYDPGSFTDLHFKRQSAKFLVRFDYNIDESNKLTVRDNFSTGTDDNNPSVGGFYAANTMYQLRNTSNSIVAQLNSVLGDKMANELLVGYTYSKDNPIYKGSLFPLVEIYNVKDASGAGTNVNVFAGAENYRIKNLLTQQDLELTDNFTYFTGKHTITVGTHNEIFAFENLYIANAYGNYDYNYYADFLNNRPAYQYQLSYSKTSNPDQDAKFKAIQYGLYAQDEWSVIPNLRVTYGLRIDIPTLLDNPSYNATFESTFNAAGYSLSTSKVPGAQVMYSPRVAFNYDLLGDRSIQLRAGTGLFTGRVPYVWISNQYGNTGVEFARLNIYNTMAFAPTVEQQRIAAASATPVATTEVDVTDNNFKMPQIWRTSGGVDVKLPFNFVGTLEGIYTQVQNDIMYQDINMKIAGYAADGRPLYGTTKSTASSQSTSWTYLKVNPTNFTNVILLSNTNQGYSANLTAQIQRANVGDGWDVNAAYVYGISRDMNSGNSSQAASQWKYNHAVDPNNPTLGYSQYDRRHRVMATVAYRLEEAPGIATSFGLYYSGLSGQPYSWIVSGDVNGDGQTSNDLAYIPNESDIGSKLILKSGSTLITSFNANDPTCEKLFGFIKNDPYLSAHKGGYAERMAAHTIWSGQADLHIGQEFPAFENHKIEITFDILNVLNMINQNWGWVRYVSNQNAFLMTFAGYSGNIPVYTVNTITDNSYNSDPASRWELQLGVKYSF